MIAKSHNDIHVYSFQNNWLFQNTALVLSNVENASPRQFWNATGLLKFALYINTFWSFCKTTSQQTPTCAYSFSITDRCLANNLQYHKKRTCCQCCNKVHTKWNMPSATRYGTTSYSVVSLVFLINLFNTCASSMDMPIFFFLSRSFSLILSVSQRPPEHCRHQSVLAYT